MNLGTVLAQFAFQLEPVWKLRHRIKVIGRRAQEYPHPKTRVYEAKIAELTTNQYQGDRLEGRLAAEAIFYTSNRKGDVDNYGKALLDGMQKAATVFKNDSQFDLVVFSRRFVPKGKEGIKVVIHQIDDTGYNKKDAVSPF